MGLAGCSCGWRSLAASAAPTHFSRRRVSENRVKRSHRAPCVKGRVLRVGGRARASTLQRWLCRKRQKETLTFQAAFLFGSLVLHVRCETFGFAKPSELSFPQVLTTPAGQWVLSESDAEFSELRAAFSVMIFAFFQAKSGVLRGKRCRRRHTSSQESAVTNEIRFHCEPFLLKTLLHARFSLRSIFFSAVSIFLGFFTLDVWSAVSFLDSPHNYLLKGVLHFYIS